MNKRNIISICIAIVVVIAIAFTVYFVTTKSNNTENAKKIVIEKYDENFNIEKTIEIKKKNQIKKIEEICSNPSLEQDEDSQYLAIRNDVKLDLGDGRYFMIQLDLPEYCYYEDANSETKLVIKMPEGLLEKVEQILAKN